jgi:lysylphosphatidylglycerol synthetase-like protein (DUF2156 family)
MSEQAAPSTQRPSIWAYGILLVAAGLVAAKPLDPDFTLAGVPGPLLTGVDVVVALSGLAAAALHVASYALARRQAWQTGGAPVSVFIAGNLTLALGAILCLLVYAGRIAGGF